MLLALLAAAAIGFSPADADLAHRTAAALVERHTPRDPGTVRARNAALFIFDAVNATGPDARIDRFESAVASGGRRTFHNVECDIVTDASQPWVVLVSHYDTKPGVECPGANDGASTSGLLVALASRIYDARPRGLNFRFVWTDGEECIRSYAENDGLWGSRRAAARLADQKLDVRAVLCLDMLGDTNLVVTIPHNGTDALKPVVLAAARRTGLRDRVRLGRETVTDDHVPFLERGFPAIDLIDFEYGGEPGRNDWWHSTSDTMDKVAKESLFVSGRLVMAIIAELGAL